VVKRMPFTPPKVESDTKTGIIHHIMPYSLSENIYKKNKFIAKHKLRNKIQ
jgi:hypothetical protein